MLTPRDPDRVEGDRPGFQDRTDRCLIVPTNRSEHSRQLGDVIATSERGHREYGPGTSGNQPTGHLMHRSIAPGGNHALKCGRMGARQFQRMTGIFGDSNIAMNPALGQTGHESLQTVGLRPG